MIVVFTLFSKYREILRIAKKAPLLTSFSNYREILPVISEMAFPADEKVIKISSGLN